MSAAVLASPESVRREFPTKQAQSSPNDPVASPTEQDLATLAYALWEERGRPLGSADADWLEAERRLRR